MIFHIYADIIEGEKHRPGCSNFKNIPILLLRISGSAHQQNVVCSSAFPCTAGGTDTWGKSQMMIIMMIIIIIGRS